MPPNPCVMTVLPPQTVLPARTLPQAFATPKGLFDGVNYPVRGRATLHAV